jgi:hypothetical protein
MSEARLIALALGLALVLAVMLYNHWRGRPYRGVMPRRVESQPGDALPDDGPRQEPVIGDLRRLQPEPPAVPDNPPPVQTPKRESGVAKEIDSIALLLADAPIAIEAIQALHGALGRLPARVLVEGLVDGLWQRPTQAVRELRIGIQLATPEGAVTAQTMSALQARISEFAAAHGAIAQLEPLEAVIARAQSLDQLAAEADIEVALNVVATEPGSTFNRAETFALLRRLGFTEEGDEWVAWQGEHPVYRVQVMADASKGTVERLTCLLDVPRVAHAETVWPEFLANARALASELQGILVDDGRRPLSDAGLASLQRSVAATQDRMRQAGIPPGSPVALRLFA